MPKSNRGGSFGRRSGTVTVIDEPVRRSSIRTAKIVFYVLWPVIGLLSATVLASRWHPILALLAGHRHRPGRRVHRRRPGGRSGPCCAPCGGGPPKSPWPSALVAGWVELADHTTLPYRIGVVVILVGVPAAIPPVRRRIIAAAWCLITRHRIRVCFSEFIITNRTGSLPLILWAIPTPRRGTGLDLAAARPGPDRPARPARPDRRRLLGRHRHRRTRLRRPTRRSSGSTSNAATP